MRHFNYFENGGPAPSSCISCGAVKELFEVGQLQLGGMAQVCRKCVIELAIFVGYVEAKPIQEALDGAKEDIARLEQDLKKVPNLVDGLIDGIRSNITDFIFAVSYSDNADKPAPVQDAPAADGGAVKDGKASAGQRKAPIKSISE
jgi:hypothetical protein